MGKFVYFTSTEKRQANEVDLPSFLRDRGEKLLRAGREYRLASDHSITVRANRWYDHAARRGGHAISFVRQFYSYGQQRLQETLGLDDAAVEMLDGYMDFEKYGKECMEADGVVTTEFGLLRRLEPPFAAHTLQMRDMV